MSKALGLAKVSAKGGFNLIWGVTISSIISAVCVIILARLLSPSEYGMYAIALIAPNLIMIFRDLGIDQATIRYAAKYNSENKTADLKKIFAAETAFEFILGSVLSLFSFLLSGFIGDHIFNRPDIVPLIQIASITILADALLKAAQSAFIGYEKMEYHSITLILHSILKSGFVILLVLLGFGVYGAIVGATVAYMITGSISILILYLTVYKKIQSDNVSQFFVTFKTMFRYGLPLSLSMIISGFLAQFYNFLIAIYCTDLLVGNYQVALNFAVLAAFFVTPVTTTLFPTFSKLDAQNEPETLQTVFQSSVKYASLLIVPTTFAIVALSQSGVSTIFGEKYEFAPLYLSLYVVIYLYTALGNLSAENLIKSQGKTQVNLKLGFLSFVIGVSLSLFLIPNFGIIGLIVTQLVVQLPSLIISLWWIKKNYKATIDWMSSAKILLASSIAAILAYTTVSQLNLTNWITLIIGATIFLITYLITAPILGAINTADTQNLKEMLKSLGPVRPILAPLLQLVEYLTIKFQKN